VRHGRIQHDSFTFSQPMPCVTGFDLELAPEAVNHDVTGRPMLRQTTAGVEGEEQEPERPAMDQARLTMPVLSRVGLGPERAGKIWKIETYYGAGHSVAWVRPEPLVELVHDVPRILRFGFFSDSSDPSDCRPG
jgi:hypothetical protein